MKNRTWVNILGLIGGVLWALAIFLRGTDITQNEIVSFLLGIAPNFGIGLLLPAFTIIYYLVIYRKEIVLKQLTLILIGIYAVLFLSEVIHDKFLNSRFDFYDMIASLMAFGIFVLSYKNKKISN